MHDIIENGSHTHLTHTPKQTKTLRNYVSCRRRRTTSCEKEKKKKTAKGNFLSESSAWAVRVVVWVFFFLDTTEMAETAAQKYDYTTIVYWNDIGKCVVFVLAAVDADAQHQFSPLLVTRTTCAFANFAHSQRIIYI